MLKFIKEKNSGVMKMKCRRCGKELGNSVRCTFCGYENFESDNVREMSNAEKNFYNGLTIDVNENGDGGERKTNSEYTTYTQGTFIFGGGNIFFELLSRFLHAFIGGNIFARLVAGILILAIAAFMFFVALPIFFVIIAVAVIGLVIFPRIKNKFKRRF